MTIAFDAIVIGSGPAGVSVAFPLVEAGLKVLMVDGGKPPVGAPPVESFALERSSNPDQWKWMIGPRFEALRNVDAISPKFRVPGLRYVFEDFFEANPVESENFVAVGSLAQGGLSNAWGCGVAGMTGPELDAFPVAASDLLRSYEIVANRIGISGPRDDDLSDYIGLDPWSQPAIELDAHHRWLLTRYAARRSALHDIGFRMGGTRVATLSRALGDRLACDRLGNCLWGCDRRALYSSAYELPALRAHGRFEYRSGLIVERIDRGADGIGVRIGGRSDGGTESISARKVFLAAGTLASTRLALAAIDSDQRVRIQTCPTAAFLLWLPRFLGATRDAGFGLGQLAFKLDIGEGRSAFGATFSTHGIPVSEFARRIPLARRQGIDLLRALMTSTVVGNLFLPGAMSANDAWLDARGALQIRGRHGDEVPVAMKRVARVLRRAYAKLGAVLLPGSFTPAKPGADVHYACTLPMRVDPMRGETDRFGQLAGFDGLHVVDGSCLPLLSEKSHTLTIMANADRIARALVPTMSHERLS